MSRAKRSTERHIGERPRAPESMGPFARKLHRAFMEVYEGAVTIRHVQVPRPNRYGPREVRRVRHKLGVSQPVFAQLLGVSTILEQSWEQGRRIPSLMARRLLDEIDRAPQRWISVLQPVQARGAVA